MSAQKIIIIIFKTLNKPATIKKYKPEKKRNLKVHNTLWQKTLIKVELQNWMSYSRKLTARQTFLPLNLNKFMIY